MCVMVLEQVKLFCNVAVFVLLNWKSKSDLKKQEKENYLCFLRHGNYTELHTVTDWLHLLEVYLEVALIQPQNEHIEIQSLWLDVEVYHIRNQRCSQKPAGNKLSPWLYHVSGCPGSSDSSSSWYWKTSGNILWSGKPWNIPMPSIGNSFG